MATRLSVRVEYLDNDLGLWCNDCRLSSGARCWFATTSCADGIPTDTSVRSAVFYTDCGSRNVVDA